MLIPEKSLPYIEQMIYLPMVLVILARDREVIARSQVKLNKPYVTFIDQTIDHVHRDLRETKHYLAQNNIKILRGPIDDLFTEFTFLYSGYEEKRRYLNVRLRNKTEELLTEYFCAVKEESS